MGKNRLEAFSDGVLAIIITIMVLELTIPHHDKLADLWELRYVLLSYVLSFVYLAIYWTEVSIAMVLVKTLFQPIVKTGQPNVPIKPSMSSPHQSVRFKGPYVSPLNKHRDVCLSMRTFQDARCATSPVSSSRCLASR